MLVLGIESSCDETAAAVVADGRKILSNVIASQVALHAPYGGVVPELASRQHLLWIVPTIDKAMHDAYVTWKDIGAIAVTYGPGLAGSLLVGVNAAKAVAFAQGLPIIPVNHMEGHLYANWLLDNEPEFPLLALIVSGGHSDLVLMRDHGKYQGLGQTRDDAAGEAFDKVARILGLGYPGGPAIQTASVGGDPSKLKLPRAWLGESYDFSFSGLKTAALRVVQQMEAGKLPGVTVAEVAASFQEAVVDVLVEKTRWAAERHKVKLVALGGGVAANALLRKEMVERVVTARVACPPPVLCTDNAAMIAAAGYFLWQQERPKDQGLDLDVDPGLRFVDFQRFQRSRRTSALPSEGRSPAASSRTRKT